MTAKATTKESAGTKQKTTNADLIRSMGDDALANAIFSQYKRTLNSDPAHLWCDGKGGCADKKGCELDCDDAKLWACILRWLRKEAISKKVASIPLRPQGTYAKWKHIFKAEQEKRLLMLPCRPGDTLYINYCQKVRPYTVVFIGILKSTKASQMNFWVSDDKGSAMAVGIEAFGVTVFRSKEAAEKALEQTKMCYETKMITPPRWYDRWPNYEWPPSSPRLSFPV